MINTIQYEQYNTKYMYKSHLYGPDNSIANVDCDSTDTSVIGVRKRYCRVFTATALNNGMINIHLTSLTLVCRAA